MKFVVSGGGTAGHINPALAVAGALMESGHEVLFAGTCDGLEARLVSQADIPFTAFEAAGFNRSKPYTLVTSTLKILSSARKARAWLSRQHPDAVIGFGGYVSIPVGLAATRLHIPLIIHEQNSACGLTNKFLAPRASAVALTYKQAGAALKTTAPIHLTGNPVRESILTADRATARASLGIPAEALVLLVFGGSLGARHINKAVVDRASELMAVEGLHIVQVAGSKEYETVVEGLRAQDLSAQGKDGIPKRWQVHGYFENMGDALAACDVALARAGATSIAEITARGIPALLVPFPFATDDHQTKNAQSVVESGAGYLIADDALDTPLFSAYLMELLSDSALRAKMTSASRSLGSADATRAVAELAIKMAQQDSDRTL